MDLDGLGWRTSWEEFFLSTRRNFLPTSAHEIVFPLGGRIPPKLGGIYSKLCLMKLAPGVSSTAKKPKIERNVGLILTEGFQ